MGRFRNPSMSFFGLSKMLIFRKLMCVEIWILRVLKMNVFDVSRCAHAAYPKLQIQIRLKTIGLNCRIFTPWTKYPIYIEMVLQH